VSWGTESEDKKLAIAHNQYHHNILLTFLRESRGWEGRKREEEKDNHVVVNESRPACCFCCSSTMIMLLGTQID
jgi:hypothetical protein